MENNVILEVFSNDDEPLYNGTAIYQIKDDSYLLKYVDDDQVTNKVRFTPHSLIMYRKGEEEIKIHLSTEKKSYIEVNTEYGWLRLDVMTDVLYCRPEFWRVSYKIPGGSDQDIFSFSWRITDKLS